MKNNFEKTVFGKEIVNSSVDLLDKLSDEIMRLRRINNGDIKEKYKLIKSIENTLADYNSLNLVRYNLSGIKSREIADGLGITEGRVSQLLKKARDRWYEGSQ